LDFTESCFIELGRAFHGDLLFDQFGLNETTKRNKNAAIVTGLLIADSLDDGLQLPRVDFTVLLAEAENPASGALGDFGSFHRMLKIDEMDFTSWRALLY
jgi:hypothetical protein